MYIGFYKLLIQKNPPDHQNFLRTLVTLAKVIWSGFRRKLQSKEPKSIHKL